MATGQSMFYFTFLLVIHEIEEKKILISTVDD